MDPNVITSSSTCSFHPERCLWCRHGVRQGQVIEVQGLPHLGNLNHPRLTVHNSTHNTTQDRLSRLEQHCQSTRQGTMDRRAGDNYGTGYDANRNVGIGERIKEHIPGNTTCICICKYSSVLLNTLERCFGALLLGTYGRALLARLR